MDHQIYLKIALDLAQESFEKGSVPVGALIVDKNGDILSKNHNQIKITNDPTAHAEVLCIREAKEKVITKFNPDETYLYTSLEPCFACSFFITRTNIKNVIWALNDPYKGGIEILRETKEMKEDINKLNIIKEPIQELKETSKELMKNYYLNKGNIDVAKLFK